MTDTIEQLEHQIVKFQLARAQHQSYNDLTDLVEEINDALEELGGPAACFDQTVLFDVLDAQTDENVKDQSCRSEIELQLKWIAPAYDLLSVLTDPQLDFDALEKASRKFVDNTGDCPSADWSPVFNALEQTDSSLDHITQVWIDTISGLRSHVESEKVELLKNCAVALDRRRIYERTPALLTDRLGCHGIVVLLITRIGLRHGKGESQAIISASEDFKTALNNARQAAKDFVSDAEDAYFDFPNMPDEGITGASIGLPAYVGLYATKLGIAIDPFAAFTGRIGLASGKDTQKGRQLFTIHRVEGIEAKVNAAIVSGYRRIFVPADNKDEALQAVQTTAGDKVNIIPVRDLELDALLALVPRRKTFQGDTPQMRKTRHLHYVAADEGWDVEPIRDLTSRNAEVPIGRQYALTSLLPSFEAKVSIWRTGSHSIEPSSLVQDFECLRELDESFHAAGKPDAPIRKIEKTLPINAELLERLHTQFLELQPYPLSLNKNEQSYTLYSFRFKDGQEKLVAKAYKKGKLQLSGSAGPLALQICGIISSVWVVSHPGNKGTQVTPEKLLEEISENAHISLPETLIEEKFPYIGSDETGKGEYFGPMVGAAVCLLKEEAEELKRAGIKDSKRIASDRRIKELASIISQVCQSPNRIHIFALQPSKYNEIIRQMKDERRTVNDLLAWMHSKMIAELLDFVPSDCSLAIADQFGNERYLRERLDRRLKQRADLPLELIQTPKGERFIAVAAASVLARDRWIREMDALNRHWDVTFPRGNGSLAVEAGKAFVARHGPEKLHEVAKYHHRTTQFILGTPS